MPEHVVHALEPVEIDEQQRDPGTAAAGARERRGHLLDEERAAAETGQAVVRRVVFEPLLEPLAFGDVLERPEERRSRARRAARSGTERTLTQRDAPSGNAMRSSHAGVLSPAAALLDATRCCSRSRSTSSSAITDIQPCPSASCAGKSGQPLERGIHERAAVVEIDLEDADRALADERAPARLAIEDGLVDRAHDRALHVGMVEQVPEHERHVVPAVVLVVHADVHFDVDARRTTAARQRVDHEREVVVVHPLRDPDAQVVEPREARRTRRGDRA